MIRYPSITGELIKGMSIYAFAKIDGSHIRAEWSRKAGFYKFGSRKRLLGTDQYVIHEAEQIIKADFEEDLSNIFRKQNYDRAIVFFEFSGDSSFAGYHEKDEDHEVHIIDVNPHKRGILPPKDYLKIFGDLKIAELLYHGPCDGDFIQLVKKSELEGMPLEGVVCKAKNPKKTPEPVMFKIKSEAWLTKLKELCGTDEKKFEELV